MSVFRYFLEKLMKILTFAFVSFWTFLNVVSELDLTSLCQDSEAFRLICCELVALAFLPIDQVWHGMGTIKVRIVQISLVDF